MFYYSVTYRFIGKVLSLFWWNILVITISRLLLPLFLIIIVILGMTFPVFSFLKKHVKTQGMKGGKGDSGGDGIPGRTGPPGKQVRKQDIILRSSDVSLSFTRA